MSANGINNTSNNNSNTVVNKMDCSSGPQDTLKRKTAMPTDVPVKKVKELVLARPSSSKPSPATMGIQEPMDPDYLRLPKGFELGDLAREKFAGIVKAELYDRYEIQIYCRLFEHFSYYPIYKFDEDVWIPAHEHAVREVVRFRTPPSILMQQARRSGVRIDRK